MILTLLFHHASLYINFNFLKIMHENVIYLIAEFFFFFFGAALHSVPDSSVLLTSLWS